MCYECCKEIKGWFKSFTRTETLLTILEGLLFVLCVGFSIFLILHLVACSSKSQPEEGISMTERIDRNETYTESNETHTKNESSTIPYSKPTVHTTLNPSIECTWEPSRTTTAATRYYVKSAGNYSTKHTQPRMETIGPPLRDIDDLAFEDQSDGEDVSGAVVLALVRVNPPREMTFGCTLTAISERWTLTAASCIEAIEEVDSLDSFVMMEGYGERRPGGTHAVDAVVLHPRYGGSDPGHDLAALRSAGRLRGPAARLPRPMDYLLLTIGERLALLGFGGFRSISRLPSERGVREVAVYSLPAALCGRAGAGAGWAPRHLSRGASLPASAGGAGPMCAGPLYARGAPCYYCAGAPLVSRRRASAPALLGLQADARQCGAACEPALYVNIALVRDWIDQQIDDYDN